MSAAAPAAAVSAVTRQRVGRNALLASLPIVAIQEGNAAVKISEEEGRPAEAAAAAANAAGSAAEPASSSSSSSSAASSDPLSQLDLRSFRVSSSFLCSTCRVAFEQAEELRAHAKTPWHVHNVRSRPTVLSEAEFEEQQHQKQQKASSTAASASGKNSASSSVATIDEDSASSGASSSDENSSSSSRRAAAAAADEDDADVVGSNRVSFYTATQKLSLWKGMLVHPLEPPSHLPLAMKSSGYLSALRGLPLVRQVAIVMVSGGRFSGAVFRDETLLASKNFQRYTTRRKQGGSQSSYDNAKGAAQSIGSSIRRKETVRFWEETERILEEWSGLLASSQRLFLFAPAMNRQHLMKSLAGLPKGMVRNVPFPTYRPTLAEVTRIYNWLNTVEFEDRANPPRDIEAIMDAAPETKASQNAIKKQSAAAAAAAAAASSATPTVLVSALASLPEPVLHDDLLTAVGAGDLLLVSALIEGNYCRPIGPGDARYRPLLYEAVARGRTEVATWMLEGPMGFNAQAVAELDEQVLDVDATDPRKIVCWGPLHRACAANNQKLALLLLAHGADPCRKDSRNRLPFSLLTSSEVRLEARRLAGSSPAMMARWDWAAAELPPLTPEAEVAAEEAKRAKAKEKKKAQKEKAKVRAVEEKAEAAVAAERDAAAVRAAQQAQALRESAQAVKDAASSRAQAVAQLSDREKRALAAERRLGAAKGTAPTCTLCRLPLVKTPFERLEYKYCSIACLQQHKIELDSNSSSSSQSKVIAHNPK